MATETRNPRKERTGVVVSDAMDKTVVVQAERRIQQTAGQLEKPDRVRLVRRDIARIRTIMNQAKAAR